MDAAVVQVSKPVWNSRHYDSAPVQPLLLWFDFLFGNYYSEIKMDLIWRNDRISEPEGKNSQNRKREIAREHENEIRLTKKRLIIPDREFNSQERYQESCAPFLWFLACARSSLFIFSFLIEDSKGLTKRMENRKKVKDVTTWRFINFIRVSSRSFHILLLIRDLRLAATWPREHSSSTVE